MLSVPTRLGEVAYRVNGPGDGPPVVMLHATLHDSRDFDPIANSLSQRYKTILVDWPWHGDSKGLVTTKDLSAPALADALEDFVSALDLPPAFFIGNSVGGYASARLAIMQPQRVRGLVLVNNGGFARVDLLPPPICPGTRYPFRCSADLPVSGGTVHEPADPGRRGCGASGDGESADPGWSQGSCCLVPQLS